MLFLDYYYFSVSFHDFQYFIRSFIVSKDQCRSQGFIFANPNDRLCAPRPPWTLCEVLGFDSCFKNRYLVQQTPTIRLACTFDIWILRNSVFAGQSFIHRRKSIFILCKGEHNQGEPLFFQLAVLWVSWRDLRVIWVPTWQMFTGTLCV